MLGVESHLRGLISLMYIRAVVQSNVRNASSNGQAPRNKYHKLPLLRRVIISYNGGRCRSSEERDKIRLRVSS